VKAFPKSPKPVNVTRWIHHGDHPEVKPFSQREITELRLPEWGLRLGIIRTSPPILIRPGDWLIESAQGLKRLSDDQFRRQFELIEDVG
jgi:hypothetical protein